MPSRQRRLIDAMRNLGVEGQERFPNPYKVLGIDVKYARWLQGQDTTNATLRKLANNAFKALSGHFHPDFTPEIDPSYIRDLEEARDRIIKGQPDDLLRWAQTEGAIDYTGAQQQQQGQQLAQRAGTVAKHIMALSRHPRNVAQAEWSQGILARRGDMTLLMRLNTGTGIRVQRGEPFILDKARQAHGQQTQLFDFQAFLWQNQNFGLEPETPIAAFIDETGRASILNADLSFIMDVTGPVAAYRKERKSLRSAEKNPADNWARASDPVFITTTLANNPGLERPESQMMVFPSKSRGGSQGHKISSLVSHLALEFAGSLGDPDFFKRAKYSRPVGKTAIGGGKAQQTLQHFGMAPAPVEDIISHDAGYTPLIEPGNSLLLFDTRAEVPIVTDTQIIGMVGNGAQKVPLD